MTWCLANLCSTNKCNFSLSADVLGFVHICKMHKCSRLNFKMLPVSFSNTWYSVQSSMTRCSYRHVYTATPQLALVLAPSVEPWSLGLMGNSFLFLTESWNSIRCDANLWARAHVAFSSALLFLGLANSWTVCSDWIELKDWKPPVIREVKIIEIHFL